MISPECLAQSTFLCDTSVLVAALDRQHVHHEASVAVVSQATPEIAYCAAHAIVEVYATLTSAVYRNRLREADVSDVLDSIERAFTVVDLTTTEYFALAREGLTRRTQSGQIYDALHIAAAAKVDADVIYTWNLKHFRALVPASLLNRITTP